MNDDLIGYAGLIDEAMRNVVKQVLCHARDKGFPGDHHCYVSFRTDYPGVSIASHLKEKYPEEMTIVLQHQFWDLLIGDEGFEVTLSFNGRREPLRIPFKALTAYADPSVKFGLQFQPETLHEVDDRMATAGDQETATVTSRAPAPEGEDEQSEAMGKVVALDAFRKK